MTPDAAPFDEDDDATPRPRAPLRGYALAVLLLPAALLLVYVYWRSAQQRELRAANAEFVAETDAATDLLRQRLLNYELVGRGGVSLFATVARPNAEQWRDFVDGLRIDTHFPAMVGLGFAPSLDGQGLRALQIAMRDAGQGFYSVHPNGVRAAYGPILFLEPDDAANRAAIGYDMFSEPVRRSAMLAASSSGEARLTAPLRLVQDQQAGRDVTGLVLYLPVYGGAATTGAERRAALRGWVYIPFRFSMFVDAALRGDARRIGVRIADVGGAAPVPMFALPLATRGAPLFERSVETEFYGRRWRLDYTSESRADLIARSPELNATLAAGLIASLLLFGAMLALARTEALAQLKAARLSESYRRSELRFRNAMRYSAIGKALLDSDGTIVDANPALARILESTPADLVGERFAGRLDAADLDLSATGTSHQKLRQVRRRDGELRDLQLVYAPVPGLHGEGVAYLIEVEDVTDRLRAREREVALNRTLEARVALRTRELTHANRELEAFAYSVSHDLRTPLRAIEGFSRLLADRQGERIDAEGRDHLARVRGATARMGELIDALLRVSRVSRGTLAWAPLDLSRMAHEVVDELRQADPRPALRMEIEPGLHACGDPALIRTLLQNLIGNAWKFSGQREDAEILFGKSSDVKEATEFYVRDNGAGFAPEYADKLFRPFQRLHGQDEFAGDGIGLASVKRILERHGGHIRAEGRPGEGATFRFTLPREMPGT